MPGLLPNVDPDGLLEYSVVFSDRTLNHMSRAFQRVMTDVARTLREVYAARAAVIVPGSGTFGMEAVDGDLMRRQSLVFADLIAGLATTPSPVIAGAYTGYRAGRSTICAAGLGTLGFTRCQGDPYG